MHNDIYYYIGYKDTKTNVISVMSNQNHNGQFENASSALNFYNKSVPKDIKGLVMFKTVIKTEIVDPMEIEKDLGTQKI